MAPIPSHLGVRRSLTAAPARMPAPLHGAAPCCQPARAGVTIAVNLSARQFGDLAFVARGLGIVERSGATLHRLILELTESLLLDEVDI